MNRPSNQRLDLPVGFASRRKTARRWADSAVPVGIALDFTQREEVMERMIFAVSLAAMLIGGGLTACLTRGDCPAMLA
jgi:hypothetical protein